LAYGHDYHPDLPTDGNFLNNGLVDPYRNPHPHLSEVKKVYEPVQFSYLGNQTIKITNKNFFADFSDKTISWRLLENGKTIATASDLKINVFPQESNILKLEKLPKVFDKSKEYILQVRLIQSKETKLISKGHEVAWDEFVLQKEIFIKNSIKSTTLKIAESTVYEIYNDKSALHIDKKTGEILNWSFKHKVLTDKAIRPNFWRPPTDNDLGNGMDKWAKVWQDASYNYKAKLIKEPVLTNKGVLYTVSYTLPNNEATVIVNYTLNNAGSLTVDYSFTPNKKELPNIPRLGMYLTLNNDFEDVSWYGKGPNESYWDRKTGQKTGIYSGKVTDQFHVYSRPQETGNKTEVRWMQIASKNMNLTATSKEVFNASVWPFSMKELDFNSDEGTQSASGLVPVTKKHGADIKIGNAIQWNIDFLQMGVGGDTSWGRLVHEKYTIPANKIYAYSFTIIPSKNN
jgi:beta-galactosidase